MSGYVFLLRFEGLKVCRVRDGSYDVCVLGDGVCLLESEVDVWSLLLTLCGLLVCLESKLEWGLGSVPFQAPTGPCLVFLFTDPGRWRASRCTRPMGETMRMHRSLCLSWRRTQSSRASSL